jgi:predicted RNA-binding Zn-ribbon protein involved in translation (DUF1610 family)
MPDCCHTPILRFDLSVVWTVEECLIDIQVAAVSSSPFRDRDGYGRGCLHGTAAPLFSENIIIWSLDVYRTSNIKIPDIVWHCHCSLKKETATMQQNEIEVFCSSCKNKITPQFGIHKSGQKTSLEIQSRRLGCSIECPYCGNLFIHKIYPDDKKFS